MQGCLLGMRHHVPDFACVLSLCLQIAKWLGAPVVLVVDCWAMARSVAAIVKGMAEFDPGQ